MFSCAVFVDSFCCCCLCRCSCWIVCYRCATYIQIHQHLRSIHKKGVEKRLPGFLSFLCCFKIGNFSGTSLHHAVSTLSPTSSRPVSSFYLSLSRSIFALPHSLSAHFLCLSITHSITFLFSLIILPFFSVPFCLFACNSLAICMCISSNVVRIRDRKNSCKYHN